MKKEFIVTIIRLLSICVFGTCFALWASQLPGSIMPTMKSMLVGWIIALVIFLGIPLVFSTRKDKKDA